MLIGWCPGGRTVADMLALYPETGAVRIFVGAGKPLPAWDGAVLGGLGGVLPHVSFKTWDLAALTGWLDAMPDGRSLILTYAHEPEQGTAAGDPTVEQFHTVWAELVAGIADHPKRDRVLLVPVYTRYWWQAHPGDLRWLITDGVDAIGWDVYNNGSTYRTPADLLSIPRDIAGRTGVPYLLAELGATRLATDVDGSGRTAWMRSMVDAARADGAWTACWFHKDEWDLTAWPAEQQTWQMLIEQEATMGRWTDLATWVGPTPNQSGPMNRWDGVVLHIAAGTYDGTIAWQRNPDADVSSHFIVAEDGRIAQMVDTNVTAWTQRAGNGEWLSVENAGYLPNPLTDAQVEANARILAKAHAVYGVPLQVTNTPDARGLGHHSMGAENGYDWGHPACPGDAIKAQKAAIVARAIQIINGEDEDMPLSAEDISKVAAAAASAVHGQRIGKQTYTFGQVAERSWSYQTAFAEQKLRDEAILASIRDDADRDAILARVDQRAGELRADFEQQAQADAQRDAELTELVRAGQSGELDATEVLRRMGEVLTAGTTPQV